METRPDRRFCAGIRCRRGQTLEITVTDIRSDKGNVLAMAKVAGREQPVYGMSPAKRGEVVVTLEGIDAETAEVSLLHDEDGDYKMKTGERGPAEGYAAKSAPCPQSGTP